MSKLKSELLPLIEKSQGNIGTVEGYELLSHIAAFEINLYRRANGKAKDLDTELIYKLFRIKDYLFV